MNKLQYIYIFLLSSCISACNTNTHRASMYDFPDFRKKILNCIKIESQSEKVKQCSDFDENTFFNFYKNELDNFPLSEAFSQLKKLSKNLNSSKDRLCVVFSYPAVGFDPDEGYKTKIYVVQPQRQKGGLFNYHKASSSWTEDVKKLKEINRSLSHLNRIESGCGSGYLIKILFTADLKEINCKAALGTSLI